MPRTPSPTQRGSPDARWASSGYYSKQCIIILAAALVSIFGISAAWCLLLDRPKPRLVDISEASSGPAGTAFSPRTTNESRAEAGKRAGSSSLASGVVEDNPFDVAGHDGFGKTSPISALPKDVPAVFSPPKLTIDRQVKSSLSREGVVERCVVMIFLQSLGRGAEVLVNWNAFADSYSIVLVWSCEALYKYTAVTAVTRSCCSC